MKSDSKKKDLSGSVFGRLSVISEHGKNKYGSVLWLCRCECGVETILQSSQFKETKSCGRCISNISARSYHLISGQRFGYLTVIKPRYRYRKKTMLICRCVCGKTIQALALNIINGGKTSCGCKVDKATLAEDARSRLTTHGKSRTVEYRAWKHMKERCTNPNCKEYKNYGGRGITVCKEWINSFECFYADMGDKPDKKLSLDRINNEKGYSKENCRWTDSLTQLSNRRPYSKRRINA